MTKIMQSDLGPVLDDLQQEGKISRINIESGKGQSQKINAERLQLISKEMAL
jgi:uncharacterized protein YidB (DUF937 family)